MKYQTIIYLFIAVVVVYFIYNKTGIFEGFTNDDFDVYVINMVSNKERLESFNIPEKYKIYDFGLSDKNISEKS